jgi:hypothetical protein
MGWNKEDTPLSNQRRSPGQFFFQERYHCGPRFLQVAGEDSF